MDSQIHKVVELVRARQLQAAHLICLLVAFVALLRRSKKRANLPTRDEILQRRNVREEMLHNLLNGGKCRDLIRMSEKAFMTLCGILKHDGGLRATQRMSVEEQVASFLHIVGNDLRNRFTSWLYRRSASTTSRCLHRVLQAIISLEDRYIQQPKGDIVPTEGSKPEAEALKTKKVSNFNEMIELFAKDRASGAHAETAKERNARFQKNDGIDLETFPEVDSFCAANDVVLETQFSTDDDIQVVPEQSSSAKKCKSRKRKVEPENEDLASMIMCNVGSVANAISEGNKILERVYHTEYTGEQICNALEPMGLESHEIRRALRYLAANQADARILFSCPPEMRLDLLKDMMDSGN